MRTVYLQATLEGAAADRVLTIERILMSVTVLWNGA